MKNLSIVDYVTEVATLKTDKKTSKMGGWVLRVALPVDWSYSSIHRYIRKGIISNDWAQGDVDGDFGEIKV